MSKRNCKPTSLEYGPFGWIIRLPNGSAARESTGRFPYHFKTPEAAIKWDFQHEIFIERVLAHGKPPPWGSLEIGAGTSLPAKAVPGVSRK